MGTLIGIISAVAWGFAFVILKKLTDYFSPYEIAFYRYLIAGFTFYLMILIKKGNLLPRKEDFLKIGISSIFGIAGVSVLMTISLRWLDTSIVGMLNGTIPLITLLFQRFWFKNKLSSKMIAALFVSLAGIVFMSLPIGSGDFIGYFLIIAGLVLWVIYTFMTSTLSQNYSGVELIGYQTVFSSIALFPFIMIVNGPSSFAKFANTDALYNMLILGVCITATAYLCYIIGSTSIGVSKMSFIMNLIPVVSLAAGFALYNEPLSFQKITGLALVLFSIFLITDNKNNPNSISTEGDSGNLKKAPVYRIFNNISLPASLPAPR